MAQQSARRGRENQGFTQCFEHALGEMDQARELPYRPAATRRRTIGRTDGSIRLRHNNPDVFSCRKGGVHRWKADIPVGAKMKRFGTAREYYSGTGYALRIPGFALARVDIMHLCDFVRIMCEAGKHNM